MGSSYIGHVEPNSAVQGAPNDGFDKNTILTITTDADDSTQAIATKEIDKPMFEIGEITIKIDAEDSAQANATKEIAKPMLEIGNITITSTMNAKDSAQASAAKEIDKPMFEIGERTITTDAEDSAQAGAAKEIDKQMVETGNTTITMKMDAKDSAQASAAKKIDKPMFEIGFIIFILVVQGVKWILFMLRSGANSLYMDLALLVLDVVLLVSLGIKGCWNVKRTRRCCCELTWSACGYVSLLLILQVARIVLTILRAASKEGKTLLLDVGMGAIDVALVALMLFKFFCV